MTNEEIIKKYCEVSAENSEMDWLSAVMDLARADEREKMKAEKPYIGIDLGHPSGDRQAESTIPTQKQGMTEADFEKAKQGAEIEKHDGTKSRVICWDLKSDYDTSIIVATEIAGMEYMRGYPKYLFMRDFRLRTTKREGWVKISKGTPCYNTREECEKRESQDGIIAHITWEEK